MNTVHIYGRHVFVRTLHPAWNAPAQCMWQHRKKCRRRLGSIKKMYVLGAWEAFSNEINSCAWLLALRSLVWLLFSHRCPTTRVQVGYQWKINKVTPQSASQLLVRLVRDQFMCWPLTAPFGKSYRIIWLSCSPCLCETVNNTNQQEIVQAET